KPFGCHVMILNTLDNLGKFEEKGDEGYFIGNSMSSKAFRVFNKRTRRVEENLHVEFLENKAIEKGVGPNLLFDIDSLTKSRNYVPVDAGTISTNLSGIKDATSQEVKKDVSSLRYIALPNWAHDALLKFSLSKPQDHCSTKVPKGSGNTNPTASLLNPPADHIETLTVESPILTVSLPVPTAYSTDSQEPSSDARLISKRVANQEETPSLDNILSLINRFEDILGGTINSDESNGKEADISNMETVIIASLTPTLKIHKDHPKSQIIGPVDTPIQTKKKSKEEELLQFKIQNVCTLVDCPKGVRPIGTKWVLKNKKNKTGIVIRNKARLVAQGHTQEEGIDYDEVFTPVVRIEAIRLLLAYASFMGFTDPEFLAKVYKVEKAMYGLHQAPRAWYGTLSKYLLKNGFQRDSDYGGATQDRKSTTRGCQFLGRRLISWQCRSRQLWPLQQLRQNMLQLLAAMDKFCGFRISCLIMGTSKYWGVLRILKIGLRLIPLVSKEKGEHNTDFHPMVDFLEASPLRTIPLFAAMLVHQGKDSGTPTEPHQTPSPKAQTPLHTTHPSSSLPPIITTFIPTVNPTETTPIRQYTRRTRISQSSVPLTVTNEPTSPQGDSSTLPHDSAPRVTSRAAVEANQPIEGKSQVVRRKKGVTATNSGDDAPIKGRSMDEGEAATERVSNDTEEMANVLTSMDATTVLTSGVVNVPTGSGSILTTSAPAKESVPTASPVFATATMVTPVTRRKGKESQQRKSWTKKHKRDYYMAVIRNNLGWKVKDFRGTFEEVEAKFNSVCKQMEDFIPMGSKEEAERIKRKGINLEQESAKNQKSSEEITEEAKPPEEVPEEKVKEMMNLVPIEEVYVDALQVKHPIIDSKVHSEGQRSYWKITRLGGSSACYQFFKDLLKHLDREDLNQLWRLVKETLSNRPPSSDKEMELWVELNRIQRQRNLYACGEGLPSEEGSSTCDDLLQTSSRELLTDGK
nr:hypothetical protein [Tanacetum cinerariifolium]